MYDQNCLLRTVRHTDNQNLQVEKASLFMCLLKYYIYCIKFMLIFSNKLLIILSIKYSFYIFNDVKKVWSTRFKWTYEPFDKVYKDATIYTTV